MKLNQVDREDLSDVLVKVEDSFGIHFGVDGLKDVKTFGELCGIIQSKLQLPDKEGCTSQQAFYKVRSAIATTTGFPFHLIHTQTELKTIFSLKQRRKQVKALEEVLDFKTGMIGPNGMLIVILFMVMLGSLFALIFAWKVALTVLIGCIALAMLANKFGKTFMVNTVGELVEKVTREHYLQVRRNPGTINQSEVVKVVKDLLCADLGLSESVLTDEAAL